MPRPGIGVRKRVKSIFECEKILLRVPNWVGDAVMCLPAIESVRSNFPGRSITALARPWVAPLMECCPAVDDVMDYPKAKGGCAYFKGIFSIAGRLRKRHFDLAILFQNAFEAAFITWCAGIPQRVGYGRDARGLLLTRSLRPVENQAKAHQIRYYLGILDALGLEASYREPRINPPSLEPDGARKILSDLGVRKGETIVGLGPGAVFGGAKRWSPEAFASVGERAAARWGAKVLIFGSEGEKSIGETVKKGIGARAYNLCGETTLNDAIALISCCTVFVTNDSGLMHVAAAMAIPTVAVFGPTDPVATGPVGALTSIVRADVYCAPCMKAECPTDHICMRSVSPEMVWNEMERLLKTGREAGGSKLK